MLILIRIRMLRILSNTDVESDREKWGKTNSDISTLVPHYNWIRIRISILGMDTDMDTKKSDNHFHTYSIGVRGTSNYQIWVAMVSIRRERVGWESSRTSAAASRLPLALSFDLSHSPLLFYEELDYINLEHS